ncbi:MAG: ribose 5-phosphate isomerase B [Tannerella sp.]|jgi:ribose 5-phosphate isomerase B|nr:ribose 5-phosphate isomerase B [Tannerella sp.]
MKTIGLAADHAGFELKEFVKKIIDSKEEYNYKDFGTCSSEPCDYPDFAHPLAEAVESGAVDSGVAFCGSGNGIGMALNKHAKIRAAICWNEETARLTRAHNDANILVFPARFISLTEAEKMIHAFFTTPFEGGRHQQRIDKIQVKK